MYRNDINRKGLIYIGCQNYQATNRIHDVYDVLWQNCGWYHITEECYEDRTRKLRDDSINKGIVTLTDEVTTFVLATSSVGYGLLANTKDLAKFSISSDNQQQVTNYCVPGKVMYLMHFLTRKFLLKLSTQAIN